MTDDDERDELHAIEGGGGRPKRLTLSQIVEMLLTRGGGERSAVTLTRTATGATAIDVKVRTGDDAETATVADAERRACEVYDRLRSLYPDDAGHDSSELTLTRNAKGETQVSLSMKSSGEGARTIEQVAAQAVREYDLLRGRYPMADGRTARPGSVSLARSPVIAPEPADDVGED